MEDYDENELIDDSNDENPLDDEGVDVWFEDTPPQDDNDNAESEEEQLGWQTNHVESEVEDLQKKVEGIERKPISRNLSFGSKVCPTRHGCQGATDCDYCLSSYPF